MTLFGRDSSSHTNYLSQAQAYGLAYHTTKITDGDHWYLDPTFKVQNDRARAFGVPVLGAYHVLWGNKSLSSQADWFVQQGERLGGFRPGQPVIWQSDNESFGYNGLPTMDQVNAFGDLVVNHGYPAGSYWAYCPAWVYSAADLRRLKYPNWWQSSYGSNPHGEYHAVYPGDASPRWAGPIPIRALQYGSNTDIGDANATKMTMAELVALVTGGTGPNPTEDDVRYLIQEAGSSGVQITDMMTRHNDFTWDEAQHWMGLGLITKPPAGEPTASPTGPGSYVWVIPKGRLIQFGPDITGAGSAPAGGVTRDEAAAIADERIGAATATSTTKTTLAPAPE